MSINYVQFHIGDFLSGTLQMDATETGAYTLLIMAHYQAGEKGIKYDRQKLSRICHCTPRQWDRIKEAILDKFYIEDGYLKHQRVIDEISKIKSKSRNRNENVTESLPKRNAIVTDFSAKGIENKQNSSPKPITNNQYTADTSAREVSHVDVGKQISKITGWDNDPSWFGNYSRIEQWLANGWCPERDIYPTIKKLMKRRNGDPPSTPKYFEKAIADAYATRKSPIPKGEINAKRNSKNRLAAEAAELLEQLGSTEVSPSPDHFN